MYFTMHVQQKQICFVVAHTVRTGRKGYVQAEKTLDTHSLLYHVFVGAR